MANADDQSNLPPIPDGGLAEAMPEWLRRPPAWRTLTDREVTAPEPVGLTELPDPDASVIDPRELLTDDDLPLWLRDLGRGRSPRQPAEVEGAVGDAAPVSLAEAPPTAHVAASSPSRFVPTTPPPTSVSRPAEAPASRPSTRAEPARSPARQGAWAVTVLAALLVVAIVIIIVLVL